MSILAWIESLVLRIYQLPMGVLAQYAVFAVLIVRVLYRKLSDRWWLRPSLGALLAVWFLSVLWTTVFSRSVGAHDVRWIPLYTCWSVLHGGNRELLRSCFMNGLLFFPAGLLWAGLLPKDRTAEYSTDRTAERIEKAGTPDYFVDVPLWKSVRGSSGMVQEVGTGI